MLRRVLPKGRIWNLSRRKCGTLLGWGWYNNNIMERIQSINPERVRWCCEDSRITVEELAAAAGVPVGNVEKVLVGEDSLTFPQLQRIAKFFKPGGAVFSGDRAGPRAKDGNGSKASQPGRVCVAAGADGGGDQLPA